MLLSKEKKNKKMLSVFLLFASMGGMKIHIFKKIIILTQLETDKIIYFLASARHRNKGKKEEEKKRRNTVAVAILFSGTFATFRYFLYYLVLPYRACDTKNVSGI